MGGLRLDIIAGGQRDRTVYRSYKTSLRLVSAVPLSKGFGCLGEGFHPIYKAVFISAV